MKSTGIIRKVDELGRIVIPNKKRRRDEVDRYMCIKSFSVEEFGDDGLPKENELFVVGKGSVWGVSNEKYRFAAGKCSTRLEAEDGRWLEVYDDKIAHNFKRI